MVKKSVPKKNIDPILVDVRNPHFNYERLNRFGTVNLRRVPEASRPRFSVLKRALVGAFGMILLGIILFLLLVASNLRTIKATITDSGSSIMKNFTSSATALKNFEPQTASEFLKKNDEELNTITSTLHKGIGQSIIDTVGSFVPIVKGSVGFLGKVTNLNLQFLELSQDLETLQTNALGYFQHDGAALIAALSKTHETIQAIRDNTVSIKNASSALKNLSSAFNTVDDAIGGEYLKYSAALYGWDNALVALVKWLGAPGDHHVLLLFQNPSEIRPGGGFVGSYADLTVSGGQMTNMDVRDIYDPDGQLDQKVVPPKQLQTLTERWGARDANWFFNFPTSAKTIVNFLEASKMYSERDVTFDAAIALNIRVLESFLNITGPIPIPEYNKVITSANFLSEIQREVESGDDKKAGEPKRILKIITPLLLERLNNLSDSERKSLFEAIKDAIQKKDIMLYAKDPVLSDFLATNDLDGSIFGLPSSFWGSYLGVVNANIAGGKSDAFVTEDVRANVDIDVSGNTFTNADITRTHLGDTQKDPWWRATNKDFIQIFTEPNATLVALDGNDTKTSYSTLDYAHTNYAVNADLAAIEQNDVYLTNYKAWQRQDSGKNVFATWFMLPSGSSKTLHMRYQTQYANLPSLASGQTYTFIFERQSGVKNSLHLVINAPFQYYWAESNDRVFAYNNDDPDARTVITLTLRLGSPNE